MFDLFNLFVSKAMAAETAAPVAEAAGAVAQVPTTESTLMRFMPLALIFVVFYFLLIRPQQKKFEAQEAMHKALKKGDKVITNGGIFGTITKLDGDEHVFVEIAKDTEIKVLRSSIASLADKGEAANQNTGKKG